MADVVKSVILDVKVDTGKSIEENAALRDVLIQLNQELKNNKRETEEQKQQYEITKASIKSHTEELNRNTRQMADQQKAVMSNKGSFNELHNSLKVGEATLKALTGTIKRNEDGTYELTQEYFNAKKGVDDAKNALLLFNAGIAQGNLNVGNYDNTLSGMRQKLADLQIVIQNTNVGDLNFEKAKNDAAALSTQIQIAEGKIDSMGERIQKNTIRDGFNDAMGAASALTGVIGVLSLAMGNDSKAGETLRKVMIGVTIAQTALTIARQKDDISGTISLVRTKALTAATWLYDKAIKATTKTMMAFNTIVAGTVVAGVIIGIMKIVDSFKKQTNATQDAIDKKKEYDEMNQMALEKEIARVIRLEAAQLHLWDRIKNIREQEALGNDVKAMKIALAEDEIKALQNAIHFEDKYSEKYRLVSDLIFEKEIELTTLRTAASKDRKKQAEDALKDIEKETNAIKIQTLYYGDLQKVQDEIVNKVKEKLKPGFLMAYGFTEEEAKQIEESISDPQIKAAKTSLDAIRQMYVEKGIIMSDDEPATLAHYQRLGEYAIEFGEHVGNIFGDTLTETGLDLKKFAGGVTLLILDMLKKTAQAAIAEITAKQIAEKGFIGILTGGLLSGIVSAAFEVAKSQISQQSNYGFYEGGYTGEGNPKEESTKIGRRDYTYHKDEYVVPSKVLNDPQGAELVTKLEKMRIANPLKLNLFGYADGGFAKSFAQSIRDRNNSGSNQRPVKVYTDITEVRNALNTLEITESRSQL